MTEQENIKIIRFGAGFYTCEDMDGEFLSSIGIFPSYGIKNNSAFSEITPMGTNESPNTKRIISHTSRLNHTGKKQNYAGLKKSFVEFQKSKNEKELLVKLWDVILTTQVINPKFILSKSKTNSHISSPITTVNPLKTREYGQYYDRYTAAGSNNQSYFTQLAPGESPNTTNHSSGCAATAWMNLLGWHDLNFTPDLLYGSTTSNNAYTNELTMQLHDYLGTQEALGWLIITGALGIHSPQGLTWPWNLLNGKDCVTEQLEFITNGYWSRWRTGLSPLEWFGIYHDGYWIFEVVKTYIENKNLPVIVGYFQDFHYCIAYETIKRDLGFFQYSFIHINRGWGSDDIDPWITPSGLFACVGIDEFMPLLSLSSLLEQPEFEADVAFEVNTPYIEETVPTKIKIRKMIVYNGIALLNSAGSFDQGIYRTTISFLVGRTFSIDENIEFIAKASFASISNGGPSVNCLYAVDSVQTYRDLTTGKIRVNIRVALRDADSYLHKISYQVIILTK